MKRAIALWLALAAIAVAQHYAGYAEGANCTSIYGWAWNSDTPSSPVQVDIYADGLPVATAPANVFRQDLLNAGYGDGKHGFSYPVPGSLKDNRVHRIAVFFAGTQINLSNGLLFSVNCSPSGGYQYYYTDPLTSINAGAWTQNGTGLSAGAGGLTATPTDGGALISKVAVPDGSSEYEVKFNVHLAQSGGIYDVYLRASQDFALVPTVRGTGYILRLSQPTFSAGGCTVQLMSFRIVNGTVYQMNAGPAPCRDGMETHVAYHPGAHYALDAYIDGKCYFIDYDTSIASGQPGIGVYWTPAGNAITGVSLGPADRIPPTPVSISQISTSVSPDHVDFRWQPTVDDPNGTGIGYYWLFRDGVLVGAYSPEMTDAALQPGTTYSYTLYAFDRHGNPAATSFPVTTAPPTAADPRRVGVRPTSSYWGGLGENHDLRSGNLNFTLPLLSAQSRGGWKLPINLTYNSQNWRQDQSGWNLGQDVGYGYGWKLLAGSLTAYWAAYPTLHHYTFVDSSGAEYRLDVNTNGVWTSTESAYVSYDSNTNRLYFNDGSFWVMGCTSAGTESDAGTMYPTVVEDSNGNQILLRYEPGVGTTWPDSSARIRQIEDVRALGDGYGGYRTYTINYDNDPVVPHITSIVNWIGTGENYTFALSGLQTLASPFDGSIATSTQYLRNVTIGGLNLTHQFETNGSGELTKVTFPYGGYLRWAYATQSYVGGRQQREVATRYLSKDGTAGSERAYVLLHDPADTGRTSHWWTVLDDPDGQSEKSWWFQTDTSQSNFGLVTAYEARPHHYPATAGGRHDDYTWTTDAAGNRYVAAVVTTEDMGNPGQVQKKMEQTRDAYGNVTQSKIYNYGNLTTPGRTYTNTYLTDSNYTSRYIRNRVASSTVSDGSVTSTLASNYYDFGHCTGFGSVAVMTNAREHDDANYGQNFWYRGNVTQSTTPTGVTCADYNTGGVTVRTTRNGIESSSNVNSSTNYAAPASGTTTTAATTNNHWTKKTLDGFGREIRADAGNGSTTVSQTDTEYDSCGCSPMGKMKRVSMPHAPNAVVYWTTYNYDGLGRTVSVVSPDGASTKAYAYSGNTVTLTDEAGKWKKYTMDALGNVVQVEEPKPAEDSVHVGNYFTTYSYDVLNNLRQVTMPRRGVTQTRTFNYGNPPGIYLQSATNPENGTVSYTYNANGLVATRTDAKGQQTQYTYDGYNRVTQIRHYPVTGGNEDACQQVNFYYDSNPYVSGYSSYSSGRLAARTYQAANCGQAANTFTEMFSYTAGGQVSKKLLRVWRTVPGYLLWADLDSSYGYDTEGKLISVTYPTALDASNNIAGGTTYTYGYDNMARLYSMTGGVNAPAYVTSATYGPAGELLNLAGTVNETRTYNNRLQLTRDAVYSYTYSASQNNGRILQQTDNVSGEQVTYQYDTLNRLISAVTADNPNVAQWGQSFLYDGFGNLTDKSMIKGSAPVWHGLADPATNRASGYMYDASGNASSPNLQNGYDAENRLSSATVWAQNSQYIYGYDPDNRRVYKATSSYDSGAGGFILSSEEITFWGVTGQRMGTYTLLVDPGGNGYAPSMLFRWGGERVYFGKRLIWRGAPVLSDRLGSIGKYFPYGEERPTATVGDAEKFATYFRESATGLDYAMNRYYDSGTGRFLTADPYGDNWDPANPSSWNMYAYVNNDPVNENDPDGLKCSDIALEGWAGITAGTKVGAFLSGNSDLSIFAETVFTEARIGWDDTAAYEKAAISAVIMNRWQFVNGYYDLYTGRVGARGSGLVRTVPDWGKADGTLSSIVYAAGQFAVWSSPGHLDSDAQKRLNAALNSDETSDQCASLLQSIGTVAGFWSARNDHTLYTDANDIIFTSFGSGAGGANKSYYETTIGSFGSANVFYGVNQNQVWRHGVPIPRPPVPRPPRRPRDVAGLE